MSGNCTSLGCGVVFKIDSRGNEKVLYTFTGGADGGTPVASLLRVNGDLYGTASDGGVRHCGVIFKLDKKRNETVLHSFNEMDGCEPSGSLLRDSSGNLYGTTAISGSGGYGTVFKLDPALNLAVLYSFHGRTDGATPFAGLSRDSKGNLYGTTFAGGVPLSCGGSQTGCGVVFRVTP